MASIKTHITKDGTPRYHVRIRMKGKKTITGAFGRLTDARRWAKKVETEIHEGRYFEKQEGSKHTFSDAIKRYCADYPVDIQRGTHLKRWDKVLGHCLLNNISAIDVADTLAGWARSEKQGGMGLGASTLNRHQSSLSVVFEAAVNDWGWITRNVVRDARRKREPRGRVRYLLDEERSALLKTCRESHYPHLYLIVVLALSTGMRKEEILSLRWLNIDLERGLISLLNTKNHERRSVSVRGHALELLKEHKKVRSIETDLLFPSSDPKQFKNHFDIRRAWVKALDDAEIENFKFHDLRHSCASYLAMNGATPLQIAEVLGHKSLDVVKRYAHLSEGHVAGVLEEMNKKIFSDAS
jgi:integrase